MISLDSDEVALAGKCQSMADVFQPASRRLIGRAARPYLEEKKITALELMGDHEHTTVFNNSAQDMQKVVQLLSAAQARTFTTDLHKRMRVVFQIADKGREKVKEVWDKGVPLVEPGGLADGWKEINERLSKDQTSVGLSILMAHYMRGAEGWMERLERAVALMENERIDPVLEQVDGLIGDVFDSPAMQKAMFPESGTLGRT
ncbi:MAG: hypothetical protein AAF684_09885, partial [Pseudomonadota bacterium]